MKPSAFPGPAERARGERSPSRALPHRLQLQHYFPVRRNFSSLRVKNRKPFSSVEQEDQSPGPLSPGPTPQTGSSPMQRNEEQVDSRRPDLRYRLFQAANLRKSIGHWDNCQPCLTSLPLPSPATHGHLCCWTPAPRPGQVAAETISTLAAGTSVGWTCYTLPKRGHGDLLAQVGALPALAVWIHFMELDPARASTPAWVTPNPHAPSFA
ncbi:uncharacterized protein WM277_024586 [Molossus nigricans]